VAPTPSQSFVSGPDKDVRINHSLCATVIRGSKRSQSTAQMKQQERNCRSVACQCVVEHKLEYACFFALKNQNVQMVRKVKETRVVTRMSKAVLARRQVLL